jgi:hypothetical protein
MCGYETKQEYFHEWIGFKKKTADNKKIKFLETFYPNYKDSDLEVLAEINSKKDLKNLAIRAGWTDTEISKYF